jgi:hypothetical protein
MSRSSLFDNDRLANASGRRRAADRGDHAADPEQCARDLLVLLGGFYLLIGFGLSLRQLTALFN